MKGLLSGITTKEKEVWNSAPSAGPGAPGGYSSKQTIPETYKLKSYEDIDLKGKVFSFDKYKVNNKTNHAKTPNKNPIIPINIATVI